MTLTGWLAWGEWRAQPVRNALSVAAIAIGVALGFAVHLINAVALDNFEGGLNRVRGSADLQIVATGDHGFDESSYPRVLLAPSVRSSIAVASPVVMRDVTLADDPATTLRISGIDVLRAARVTPLLIGRPETSSSHGGDETSSMSLAWFDADAIQVAASLLTRLGKQVGDPLAIRVDGRAVTLRIAGRLDEEAETSIVTPTSNDTRRLAQASMDIAGAQWRLGRLGRLSRIDLRLVDGADAGKLRAALAPLLPADAQINSAADDRARTGDLSRAYRVNLDMLALMALFTGAFLVYSTQSLAVARRRAQLALLRVIGVTRSRVVTQVLIEGVLQGLIGGAVGLVAGVAFAAAALRFFGGDLGGGYFTRTGFDLHRLIFAAPDAAALFFVLGLAAALIGSFLPARNAARAAPAIALKSAGSDLSTGRASPWIALALIAAGIGSALLPAIAGLPIAGYVAMALLLFGGIAAMPWIAQSLLAPLASGRRPRAVAIDLAWRRLRSAPSAASVALCGIVASASLMVAMTVMIASFRHSVDAWLLQLLSADLYLRTNTPGDGLAPVDVERLRRVDGVARIDLQKVVPLSLSPSKPNVSLIVRTLGDDPDRSIPLVKTTAERSAGAIPIWVSEAMVDLYGAALGKPLALPLALPQSHDRYVVAGIWRDYARQFGSIVIRRDDYTRVTGDARFTDAAIMLRSGASARSTTESLRAALPESLRPRAEFAEPAAIRKLSLAIFDRSFAVTYLLQAVAIAIGLAGVAATFSAQTLARSKEFGMLRHIGVLKRQITAELASEGALLGVLGAVAGGLLGLAMSQVLIHVVNPQSFHWTMDTEVPWRTLAIVGGALIAASAGTAVISGRRALAHDAVLAVREDW
jgi:putative ABC transport system permease protein